jgi:hypothetical protein
MNHKDSDSRYSWYLTCLYNIGENEIWTKHTDRFIYIMSVDIYLLWLFDMYNCIIIGAI